MASGWHITVYRQQNDGMSPAASGAPLGTKLAVWQAGWAGLNWLIELAGQGQAIGLAEGGYPTTFTATAASVVPQVVAGPPYANAIWLCGEGDILTASWPGRTTTDAEALNACSPGAWMPVQAGDES